MTAAPVPTPAADELSDAEYHALAMAVLSRIETTLDRWLDEDRVDIDTHRTGGLLELSLPGGSKIILNLQPPLHELWMAARSGGYHYKYRDGAWRDSRDGSEFFATLSRALTEQCGQALTLAP